jgi:NAD(P)-dependent dehydrogenase (short-subunit alcohol dehydrogenase family)
LAIEGNDQDRHRGSTHFDGRAADMEGIADHVAIITGAGQGLGRATAEHLAREDAVVVIADINGEMAENVARTIGLEGGQAIALAVDVTSAEDARRMVDTTLDMFGRVDILVNNAAITGPFTDVANYPEDDWNRVMAVNLTGPFLCTKFVLPMQERGGGSIVSVSSVSGVLGHERQSAYNTSKHGLIGLTRCIAQDYGRFGIRANAVCPTGMNTPMTKATLAGGRELAESVPAASMTVLGRLAEPIEVARAIAFLASDSAAFITGAVLMVDGGSSAMQPAYHQLAAEMKNFLSMSTSSD